MLVEWTSLVGISIRISKVTFGFYGVWRDNALGPLGYDRP